MTGTIAAIATPPGRGAIAVLRVSGPEALAVCRRILHSRTLHPRVQTFGQIRDAAGEIVDEVLAAYFPAPRSYTGEDLVEISCHGGPLVTQAVYEALLGAGARPAEPGEFTQRAFLNEKLDLTQAEAVMDLISAQTNLARRTALAQLRGRLGHEIETIRQDLIQVIAHVEAYIDFPDEDIDPETGGQIARRIESLSSRIQTLAATADQGRLLREGIRTVLCGEPNAGKSSLLNRLTGYDRAIVASQPGTTRDTIEESINLRGIPLRLVDTAGLREPLDSVEREGVARSTREIAEAELVLEVIDGHLPPSRDSIPILPAPGAIHLRILNKADLGLHALWSSETGSFSVISCESGAGLDDLQDRMLAAMLGDTQARAHPEVAVNARHLHALRSSHNSLREAVSGLENQSPPELTAADLRSALHSLDEILGKTDIESILGEIFRSFCIGK